MSPTCWAFTECLSPQCSASDLRSSLLPGQPCRPSPPHYLLDVRVLRDFQQFYLLLLGLGHEGIFNVISGTAAEWHRNDLGGGGRGERSWESLGIGPRGGGLHGLWEAANPSWGWSCTPQHRLSSGRQAPQPVCKDLNSWASLPHVGAKLWCRKGSEEMSLSSSLCQLPDNVCGGVRPIWKLDKCAREKTTTNASPVTTISEFVSS